MRNRLGSHISKYGDVIENKNIILPRIPKVKDIATVKY